MARVGIKIAEILEGSPADRLGLVPGDEILTINGHPIPDEIALKFHLAEDQTLFEVRRIDGVEEQLQVDLPEGSDLGIRVEDFRTRTCNNACLFCFIDQLPPGVRPTLKVKDDDFRLSFLHGNYITLTNVTERDLDRMIEQALSPLYVSVHATEPDLRTLMLGRRKVDDLERKMRKLVDAGIRLHTQVVLMPGINDGIHLERTVHDLYRHYPGVASIAIVPLGLSDHGTPRQKYAPVTDEYCRELVHQVEPWQLRFRGEIGRTFAYMADEFYIQGRAAIPGMEYYDDFEQIEDGVGMVRKFVVEFSSGMSRRRKALAHLSGTLATGKLFFPYLAECIHKFNERFDSRLKVAAIENRFMGSGITVAGLLAGRDILADLRGTELGNFVIIPQEAVSRIDHVLVDDFSVQNIEENLGRPVYPSGKSMPDFFRLLFEQL